MGFGHPHGGVTSSVRLAPPPQTALRRHRSGCQRRELWRFVRSPRFVMSFHTAFTTPRILPAVNVPLHSHSPLFTQSVAFWQLSLSHRILYAAFLEYGHEKDWHCRHFLAWKLAELDRRRSGVTLSGWNRIWSCIKSPPPSSWRGQTAAMHLLM